MVIMLFTIKYRWWNNFYPLIFLSSVHHLIKKVPVLFLRGPCYIVIRLTVSIFAIVRFIHPQGSIGWTVRLLDCRCRSDLIARQLNTVKHEGLFRTLFLKPEELLGQSISWSCQMFTRQKLPGIDYLCSVV